MAYSTDTSILAILPGLPQTTTAARYTNTVSLIGNHISRADNLINSKIAKRYDVPFTTTPPIIKTLSEDITSYFTYRSVFSGDNQNDNQWTDKFKDAVEILDQIRDGKMDLIDTSGSLVPERSTTASTIVDSNTRQYAPFFNVDTSTSWEHDPDLLDEVEDDRS